MQDFVHQPYDLRHIPYLRDFGRSGFVETLEALCPKPETHVDPQEPGFRV